MLHVPHCQGWNLGSLDQHSDICQATGPAQRQKLAKVRRGFQACMIWQDPGGHGHGRGKGGSTQGEELSCPTRSCLGSRCRLCHAVSQARWL